MAIVLMFSYFGQLFPSFENDVILEGFRYFRFLSYIIQFLNVISNFLLQQSISFSFLVIHNLIRLILLLSFFLIISNQCLKILLIRLQVICIVLNQVCKDKKCKAYSKRVHLKVIQIYLVQKILFLGANDRDIIIFLKKY